MCWTVAHGRADKAHADPDDIAMAGKFRNAASAEHRRFPSVSRPPGTEPGASATLDAGEDGI